jgi:uncharacterized protein YpbB
VQPIDTALLNIRVQKAKQFFAAAIHSQLLTPLENIKKALDGKTKVKQYLAALKTFETTLWKKLDTVQRAAYGEFRFEIPEITRKETAASKSKSGNIKGGTQLETLTLYKQGFTPEEIAKQRTLATSTILGHLASFVASGEINVLDFIDEKLLVQTEKIIAEINSDKLGDLRPHFGEEVTFADLRFAVNYLQAKREKTLEG